MGVYNDRWDKRWFFDPENLFHQTTSALVYPVSDAAGQPTHGRFYRQAAPSAVLLDDGRVLHGWHETRKTSSGNGRYVPHRFYLGHADDEASYIGDDQSVDWDARIPIFWQAVGTSHFGQLSASISRLDDDRLLMLVVSDVQHTSLEVGDRTLVPASTHWMAYDTTNDQMYGFGGTGTNRTDRLWTVNTTTGNWHVVKKMYTDTLDSNGPWNVGDNAGGLAYNGTNMYAFDSSANTLHTVDLAESQLSSSIGGTGVTGELDMAWDGSTMYGITASTLYTVNTGTGAWSSVGSTGVTSVSIVYDSTNSVMYGITASTLYTVNTGTGAWTSVGSTGLSDARGLAYDPDTDTLYCCDGSVNAVYTVNRTTGAATLVGAPTHNNHVAWWPGWGTFAYVSYDEGDTWLNELSDLTYAQYTDTAFYTPPEDYTTLGAGLRPFTYAYADPPVSANWARDVSPGVAFTSQTLGTVATTHVLHRDSTFNYNVAWPALMQVRDSTQVVDAGGVTRNSLALTQLWPIENPVDTAVDSFPADYDEYRLGDQTTYGWLPGDLMIVRDAWDQGAGGDREISQEFSHNLAELNGTVYIGSFSHEGAGDHEGSGRLLSYQGSGLRYVDNWYDRNSVDNSLAAFIRMDPSYQSGKWMIWACRTNAGSTATTAGIYTGPDAGDPPGDLGDYTYGGTTSANYAFRHPVRLVRGDTYVWFYRCTGSSVTNREWWGVQSTTLGTETCVAPVYQLHIPYPKWMRDDRWDRHDQNWQAFVRWEKAALPHLPLEDRCRIPYPKARDVLRLEQNWLAVERWTQTFCWSRPFHAPRKRSKQPTDDELNWYELVRWVASVIAAG